MPVFVLKSVGIMSDDVPITLNADQEDSTIGIQTAVNSLQPGQFNLCL